MLTTARGGIVAAIESGCFDIALHGCNCFQTMGSGVAAILRERWPEVYEADLLFGHKGDPLKLGYYSEVSVPTITHDGVSSSCLIINAYTQFDYGHNARYVEYCAVASVLSRLALKYRNQEPLPRLVMPRIGCGLAGGDWRQISRIIDVTLPGFPVTVVGL